MEDKEFISIIKEYISSKIKNKDNAETKKRSNDPNNELSVVDYSEWLDKAAKNSDAICIITHPAKYTNSEVKTTNIKTTSVDVLAKENYNTSENSSFLVNTLNLKDTYLDLYCNAAYLGYAGFLLLKNPKSNNYLINEIISGNINFLYAFSNNKEKVTEWANSFKDAVKEKSYISHTLAKQTYFPISENEYHIVCPLMASSLYHKIYEKISFSRYSEESKNLREKRKKLEFSEERIIEFPNLTEMKFGGTKPQNISYLNSLRSGKILLLSSAPPVWNKNKSKKLISFNTFWKEFERITYKKMKKLKFFLLTEKNNNYQIREDREKYISDIIESFIFYIITIKNDEIKYKLDDSILTSYLNIFFQQDKNFSTIDLENSITIISNEFTLKFIKKLETDKLTFSNDEYSIINKLIKNEIRELIKNS